MMIKAQTSIEEGRNIFLYLQNPDRSLLLCTMWAWTYGRLLGLKLLFFSPTRLETTSHCRNLEFCLRVAYEGICPLVLDGTLARNREERIEQVTADLDAQYSRNKVCAWPGFVQWPSASGILAQA